MKFNHSIKTALLAGLVATSGGAWAQASRPAAQKNKVAPKKSMLERSAPVVDQISGQGYGLAGCGLGSIVFGQKTGMVQIIAVTSNGLWGNQTFGISSGTSNCVNSNEVAKQTEAFIENNQEVLKKEIAQGRGESVNTLASLLQCSDAAALGQGLQSNFENIFRATESDSVYRQIQRSIRANEQLSAVFTPAV